MVRKVYLRITVLLTCLVLAAAALIGFSVQPAAAGAPEAAIETQTEEAVSQNMPKYVFLFIGDGMSHVQVNAAQVFNGNNTAGEVTPGPLNFTQFPVAGVATTYDSTSFCPDSASTATALSCGVKTHSGVIGLEVDKTTAPDSITELLKADGKKIGIVSSVTINHATPAAFYSHIASRNDYYDIALQMANSNFDYFGGGSINQAYGSTKNRLSAYSILANHGYTIARTKDAIEALDSSSGKVFAQSPGCRIPAPCLIPWT